MKKTVCSSLLVASVLIGLAQVPHINNEYGKQYVLDGREILAFDKARLRLSKLESPMEKNLERYWIGVSETNSHYIFFFYAKPPRGSKPSEWSLRNNEYSVKVDRRSLVAGPFTRSQ